MHALTMAVWRSWHLTACTSGLTKSCVSTPNNNCTASMNEDLSSTIYLFTKFPATISSAMKSPDIPVPFLLTVHSPRGRWRRFERDDHFSSRCKHPRCNTHGTRSFPSEIPAETQRKPRIKRVLARHEQYPQCTVTGITIRGKEQPITMTDLQSGCWK
jgi:hypothetical protein